MPSRASNTSDWSQLRNAAKRLGRRCGSRGTVVVVWAAATAGLGLLFLPNTVDDFFSTEH